MSKFFLPVDLGPFNMASPPHSGSGTLHYGLPPPSGSGTLRHNPHFLVDLGPFTTASHPYLLRDLELSDHAQLIVHLDAAFDQLQLCALQIREVELIDVELGGPRQHFLLWEGLWG